MADKKSCLWYEKATASIYFPEGHVCCDLCACMETYARKQCRLTGGVSAGYKSNSWV